MKLRTLHLWSAVVVWLYAVNFGVGFFACYREWRPSDQPRKDRTALETLTTVVPMPTTVVQPPTTVVQPPTTVVPKPTTVVQPPTTVVPKPTTVVPMQTTLAQTPTTVVQTPTTVVPMPATVVQPPTTQPPPKLKGRVIVLVLSGEGIGRSHGYYDRELAAVGRAKPDDLVGGTVWVLGPGAEPRPWPGPDGPKSFACDQAAEAFASVKEALTWFDSHAETPGLPVVLIWPCDQNPDLAAAPAPARAEGRVEYVVWVGASGDADSRWLAEGFGASYVTRIPGQREGQLARSVRFILDTAGVLRRP